MNHRKIYRQCSFFLGNPETTPPRHRVLVRDLECVAATRKTELTERVLVHDLECARRLGESDKATRKHPEGRRSGIGMRTGPEPKAPAKNKKLPEKNKKSLFNFAPDFQAQRQHKQVHQDLPVQFLARTPRAGKTYRLDLKTFCQTSLASLVRGL